MKPFSQKGLATEKPVYNYRHSKARRISENGVIIMPIQLLFVNFDDVTILDWKEVVTVRQSHVT